jgi:KN motif and ankyrin repeat domain-containing protein
MGPRRKYHIAMKLSQTRHLFSLMCAAEHGHKELVKILLKRPNTDASLMDCDNQSALSIAVENGHRDIGILIYGYLNHTRYRFLQ